VQKINYITLSAKLLFSICIIMAVSCTVTKRSTAVSIGGNQFYINGQLTYKGRYWKGNKIEGLLLNARMVQGMFDDLNPATRQRFQYADTKLWDAERNNLEFVSAMQSWHHHGLLCFTLNLQGGSPLGYGNQGWINSAFDSSGNLRPAYMLRLKRILDKADSLGMVVILGYFYFGQDEQLKDEKAVLNAVDNITHWLLKRRYKNILVEVNNECDISYDHKILQPGRVQELIERIQSIRQNGYRLPVSTSYGGGAVPRANVLKTGDYILLHGNGVENPADIAKQVAATKAAGGYRGQPILYNEDDHFHFEADTNHFTTAIRSYASWGYFDYRMKDEGFENGYQSIPVDWGINSVRKKQFFKKLKEITGY
jgi:hypothetical protein